MCKDEEVRIERAALPNSSGLSVCGAVYVVEGCVEMGGGIDAFNDIDQFGGKLQSLESLFQNGRAGNSMRECQVPVCTLQPANKKQAFPEGASQGALS